MPSFRRKPRYVEDHKPALREEVEPPIDNGPLVARHYEKALTWAQQGRWEYAHEERDIARGILNGP